MNKPAPLEQALVAHHNALLPEPVSTRVPATRPPAFVKLTRAGGGGLRQLVLTNSSVLYECWGSTDALAWDLAARTWSQVAALPDATLNGVYVNEVVSLQDPVNFPDSASGSPRYQFLANLTCALEETQ